MEPSTTTLSMMTGSYPANSTGSRTSPFAPTESLIRLVCLMSLWTDRNTTSRHSLFMGPSLEINSRFLNWRRITTFLTCHSSRVFPPIVSSESPGIRTSKIRSIMTKLRTEWWRHTAWELKMLTWKREFAPHLSLLGNMSPNMIYGFISKRIMSLDRQMTYSRLVMFAQAIKSVFFRQSSQRLWKAWTAVMMTI